MGRFEFGKAFVLQQTNFRSLLGLAMRICLLFLITLIKTFWFVSGARLVHERNAERFSDDLLTQLRNAKNNQAELKKILDSIESNYWKIPIEEIRNCLSKGETIKASKLKSKLPAFTVSATFNKSRKLEHLDKYSSVIHLDYDKVDNLSQVKESLCNIKYTYCVFVSPSGNGLKVFVRVDSI